MMKVVVKRLLAMMLAVSMLMSASMYGMAEQSADTIVSGSSIPGSSGVEDPDDNNIPGSSGMPPMMAVGGAWAGVGEDAVDMCAEPYRLNPKIKTQVFIRQFDGVEGIGNGPRIPENLTRSDILVTTPDGKTELPNGLFFSFDPPDSNSSGTFYMWGGDAEEALVTIKNVTIVKHKTSNNPADDIKGDVSFIVTQDPDDVPSFIGNTTIVPHVVHLSISDNYTNLFGSTAKSNDPDKVEAMNRDVRVGLAFIDYSKDISDENLYSAKVNGVAATNVKFEVTDSTIYNTDKQDKVGNTGVSEKGINYADFSTYQGVEWRESGIEATLEVDGVSYTAMPYVIRYNEYFEKAEEIFVKPDKDNFIYIDSLNKLIEQHAIPMQGAIDGYTVPYLVLPADSLVIPNPVDNNKYTIIIPDEKCIKLRGPRGAGANPKIYGNLFIEGRGYSRSQAEGLDFHGKNPKDANYLPQSVEKYLFAISGGEFQLQGCRISDYLSGVDMAGGPKQIYGCRVDHCYVGLMIDSKDLTNLEFNKNTFEANDRAVVISTAAEKAADIINLRGNWFLGNKTSDIEYDVSSGKKMYLTQNFFGDRNRVAAPAKIFGNVQISPFYTTDEMSVLSVNKDEVFDGKNYNIPVATNVKGTKMSDDVIEMFMNESRADEGADRELSIPLRDNSNMTSKPLASWSFTKQSLADYQPGDGVAMDVGIRTDSEAIGSFTGEVSEYQPISFAHSGKLPGTATVQITDTSAVDENKPMFLYKIVDGKLAKQTEAVSYKNDMFVFDRGDCSDYLITNDDVVYTPDDNTGNNTGSNDSGSSSGGSGSITADDVASKLNGATTGGSLSLSVASSPNVSNSVFELLGKKSGVTLTLKGDGFTWSFLGSDITSTAGLPTFNANISKTSPNAALVEKIAGTKNFRNVYFSYHGKLPGKATVELEVVGNYRDLPLNFYYINPTTKKPELVASGLDASSGKVKVSITHCSDYILTPEKLAGTTNTAFANPETGGYSLRLFNKLLKLYYPEL